MFGGKETDLVDPAKEQGSRAAGYAIGPMFGWYFILQGACGFIALATAYPLLKRPSCVHRWRFYLLVAAICLVLVSWKLERTVHDLRDPRNRLTDVFLKERTKEAKDNAENARTAFGRWHLGSVAVNLATILCVTAAMALAGNLENAPAKDAKEHEENQEDAALPLA
jgi:hypothetical protein